MISRPTTKEELFNLRHASMRNVIERIFGVLKRRFQILNSAPEYNMDIQARIPVSLAALQNFIRLHDPIEEPILGSSDHHFNCDAEDEDYVAPVLQDSPINDHDQRRDQIAEAMWTDYQRICQERADDSISDDEDENSGDDDRI